MSTRENIRLIARTPLSSIGPVVSEEKMFENVDGRRTDAGVIGILIAHIGTFGSGELKRTGPILAIVPVR